MNSLIRRCVVGLIALSLLGIGVHKFSYRQFSYTDAVSAQGKAPTNWEPTIKKFEDQDKIDPPQQGEIVFTGASSIVRWKTLQEDFAPLYVINRGFGGSQYSDLNKYAERIVVAYHPRAVVVYEGDNDLAEGSPKTPEQVANDSKEFIRIVHADLPQTWIYVMSIKPSKLRWKQWPNMKAANELMAEYIKAHPDHLQLLDISSSMIDPQTNLPCDCFVEDGLHPTAKLYSMWTAIIKPVLMQRFGSGKMTGRNLGTAPNLSFGLQNESVAVAR
jgi:lysophospholipase L1-like esterase